VRTRIALSLCASIVAGCVANTQVSPQPSMSGTSSPVASFPASAPATAADASNAPCPTHAPADPQEDRYPAALTGRLFLLAGCDSDDLTLGRIGIAGRLALGRGEQYLVTVGDSGVTTLPTATGTDLRLRSFATGAAIGAAIPLGSDGRVIGVVGDLIVTSITSGTGSSLVFWSSRSGDETGSRVDLPSMPDPFAFVQGSDLIVGSVLERGPDAGLVLVSAVDRSVRRLVEPVNVGDLPSPERVVVMSSSGGQLATTVCATGIDFVGDCHRTVIVDIATGTVRTTVDLRGRQPTFLSERWLVASLPSGDRLVDLNGHEIWSTAPLGVGAGSWHSQIAPDGRFVVEIRSIAGNIKPLVLAVDPSTGRQTTLYRPKSSDWHIWPSLSTDTFLAIGDSDFNPPCTTWRPCGPDELRVADAATLDLTTGVVVPHAIHITFTP
jgi:hypothetical protein